MLTYEHVVSVLFSSIERTGLNVVYTQELLDVHALARTLNVTCLPQGLDDDEPAGNSVRAIIGFRWSPELTVASLQQNDTAALLIPGLGATQPAALALDLCYSVPLSGDQMIDVEGLPLLVRAVQDLHRGVTPGGTHGVVEAQVTYSGSRAPRIQTIHVRQLWPVADALFNPELLSENFDALCAELYLVLETFAMHFGTRPIPPLDDEHEERQYLKPPTA